MDIKLEVPSSTLFDADKINNGIWIHLEAEGEDDEPVPLYAGGDKTKPIRALVRSARCDGIRQEERRNQTAGMTKARKAPKKEKDAVISESIILTPEQRFQHQLRALENVSSSAPGIVYLDGDQVKSFFRNKAYDEFVQQIIETSNDDSKYRAGTATEAGNGSASMNSTQLPKDGTSENSSVAQ